MIGSLISGEKGEVHPSVFTVLYKPRVGRKGIRTRMFKNENTLFIQDICVKNKIRKLWQARVIEGRICKNKIKGLRWFLQVPESICSDYCHLLHLHASAGLLYKFEVHGCHLNGKHRSCSSGGKLIGDAAGTGEQVQYIQIFDTELVNQNVKETLLCKIGSGPGFEISRWANLLAPEYAADYTHLLPSERIMKRRICSLFRCSR